MSGPCARATLRSRRPSCKYDRANYSGMRTRSGMMPTSKYAMAHPEAQLTKDETEELARGLDATLGTAYSSR